jgi:hypothetical protein
MYQKINRSAKFLLKVGKYHYPNKIVHTVFVIIHHKIKLFAIASTESPELKVCKQLSQTWVFDISLACSNGILIPNGH